LPKKLATRPSRRIVSHESEYVGPISNRHRLVVSRRKRGTKEK
jgi:hypothetical protein